MTTTLDLSGAANRNLPAVDVAKMTDFMQRAMADLSSAIVGILCSVGDRLGLFRDLAAHGPATGTELAQRTGIQTQYATEWLRALACAGYLDYDSSSERFSLPLEHAIVLAYEGGPMFMGGAYQQLPGLFSPLEQLVQALQKGGGVPQIAYHSNLRDGMERMSATWFEHLLVSQWLPAVPDVATKLEQGIRVADLGCGGGRALIKLAQTYPNSRYVGYDRFAPAIERAIANAQAAGVSDRIQFEQRDVLDGLPGEYGLITAFDSMHDFAHPLEVLQGLRRTIDPDGTLLVLEMNCSENLEENFGQVGTIFYGTSFLYSIPVSIANGGEGLGAMGLSESRLSGLCATAGFGTIRRLPIQNPFNVLYEVKP